MTFSRIAHSIVMVGGVALIACVPNLTGAPCHTEANCLEGQSCVSGFCAASGSNGGGGGSVPDDGGGSRVDGGGGGTGGGSGSTDAGHSKDGGSGGGHDGGGVIGVDAGPVFDGGTGEGNKGSCFDGIDNDGDGKVDCADSDCVGQACRPPVGECDVVEVCVAGMNSCPSDTLASASTTCGPPASCTDGTIQAQSFCNGNGVCNLKSAKSCGGYKCSGTTCSITCNGDGDCDSTHYCSNTTCVPKLAQGGMCQMANQCGTGNCAEGRCCDTACKDACDSCNNMAGMCVHAAAGSDPKMQCNPGTCDGNGACSTMCSGMPVCGNTACAASSVCLGTQCSDKKVDNVGCTDGCECKSGVCTLYYIDSDGDGYGLKGSAGIGFCGGAVTRPGYSTTADDACDMDKAANPSVVDYFATTTLCGNFDWNSDGLEQKETATYLCTVGGRCRSGYSVDTACGNLGTYGICPTTTLNCSPQSTVPKYLQKCH